MIHQNEKDNFTSEKLHETGFTNPTSLSSQRISQLDFLKLINVQINQPILFLWLTPHKCTIYIYSATFSDAKLSRENLPSALELRPQYHFSQGDHSEQRGPTNVLFAFGFWNMNRRTPEEFYQEKVL